MSPDSTSKSIDLVLEIRSTRDLNFVDDRVGVGIVVGEYLAAIVRRCQVPHPIGDTGRRGRAWKRGISERVPSVGKGTRWIESGGRIRVPKSEDIVRCECGAGRRHSEENNGDPRKRHDQLREPGSLKDWRES